MFNNMKLESARKRREESAQPVECQTKLHRTSIEGQTCFICDNEAPSTELKQVMMMNFNNRLNECAQTLSDGKLLARLYGGDAIAQELKYHFACLTDLYNREDIPHNHQETGTGTCTQRGCPPTSILRASNISSGDHQVW